MWWESSRSRRRWCWHRDSEQDGFEPATLHAPQKRYRGPAGACLPAGPRQGDRFPMPRRCRGDGGFGTRAGRAAGRSRSLPQSPRRTGGSGVAPAERATADNPPGTWHGVVAGRAAASRRGCASRAAAGRDAPETHSSLCRLTAARRRGFPARCHATAAAAMTVAAVHHGIRSHPLGWRPLCPVATPSP